MQEEYSLAPDQAYYVTVISTQYLSKDSFAIEEGAPREIEVFCSRSGAWEKLRNDIVKKHPWCMICGKNKSLQLHHIRPFHLYPELELTEDNLRVLCQSCHLVWGHLGDWKSFNLDLDKDIVKINNRPYTRI